MQDSKDGSKTIWRCVPFSFQTCYLLQIQHPMVNPHNQCMGNTCSIKIQQENNKKKKRSVNEIVVEGDVWTLLSFLPHVVACAGSTDFLCCFAISTTNLTKVHKDRSPRAAWNLHTHTKQNKEIRNRRADVSVMWYMVKLWVSA